MSLLSSKTKFKYIISLGSSTFIATAGEKRVENRKAIGKWRLVVFVVL